MGTGAGQSVLGQLHVLNGATVIHCQGLSLPPRGDVLDHCAGDQARHGGRSYPAWGSIPLFVEIRVAV